MKHSLPTLAVCIIFLGAGCSETPQKENLSSMELPDGVRPLPEGAGWQDVFEDSDGSTEWEAKTYEIGSNDISFEVSLVDPVMPDSEALSYQMVLRKDSRGFPLHYRMFLRTGVCLDGTCKLLMAKLYWDALGGFVRFEYPQGTPFTKWDHNPFNAEDYEKLHNFLSDPYSILGTHPIGFFVVEHAKEGDADLDSETSATPPDAKAAVVEGAAYTTWVLWRWVHGEVVEQLRTQTRSQLNDDYLLECLGSNDRRFVEFALNELEKKGLYDNRFYESCLQVLEQCGERECILALDVLKKHVRNQVKLHADMIKRIGINGGSSRILLDYFEKLEAADIAVWRQLASQMDHMTMYKNIETTLDILHQRAVQDSEVRKKVNQLMGSGDPHLKKHAENFLR